MNKVAQVNDEGASRCPSFLAVMRCTALYRFLRMLVKQCETDSRNLDQMVLFIFCREARKLHPHVLV